MREQSHLKCPGLSSSANGYQPVGGILLVFRPQSHPLKDQILGFSKQELFLTGRCKREEDVPMYWFTPPNIDRAQAGWGPSWELKVRFRSPMWWQECITTTSSPVCMRRKLKSRSRILSLSPGTRNWHLYQRARCPSQQMSYERLNTFELRRLYSISYCDSIVGSHYRWVNVCLLMNIFDRNANVIAFICHEIVIELYSTIYKCENDS